MDTNLYTFIDIFNTEFCVGEERVLLNKIIIPIIQRDYAQGRIGVDTDRVRMRFLNSLYRAFLEKPIILDFVYGDLDVEGKMTPLDGQQRLTTLFLLHWYVAKKEKIAFDEYEFLFHFSYETRYSARDFCECLIKFTPTFSECISEEIIDQPWFPLDWKKDATISAMLVMIDAISDKFSQIENMWAKLKDGVIQFYFLPIKDMGLTDDLYIKMNSRGKPLTQFEHFKAELEQELCKIDEDLAKRIIKKIDIDWTDMLWEYRGEDNLIDDEFLRYFKFVCDILCYQKGETTQGKNRNEFDLLKEYFSAENKDTYYNVEILEAYFDCWCKIKNYSSPKLLFEHFISSEHEVGKIKLESSKIDIFADCVKNYADVLGSGNRTFPLNRIILLYAFVTYLINIDDITEKQFARRLRMVHNLIRNSEDEISDSEQRSAGNRMPAILRKVDFIVRKGEINMSSKKVVSMPRGKRISTKKEENSFNSYQLNEEEMKNKWIEKNPEYAEKLFTLEDHDLLKGQIAIVGLEEPELFDKFIALFECDWDFVDCALMSIGDYLQCERNGWRCQAGSSEIDRAWIELFHRSSNSYFDETKKVLNELLHSMDEITNKKLCEITKNYLKESEENSLYEWRYYYVKYKSFRPGRYGKYTWYDFKNGYYDMRVLWTRFNFSENAYNPFLYEVNPNLISRGDFGAYMIVGDRYIEGINDGFVFYDMETDKKVKFIKICRNSEGIDIEDRIKRLKKYLKIKK